MKDLSEQEITERFAQLPEVVQKAIQSNEVSLHIRDVAKTYSLHIDQIGALEYIALLVMLGFEELTTFPKNIEEALQIPHDLAEKISADINSKVFLPVRESMKQPREQAPATPAVSSQTPAPAEYVPTQNMLVAPVISKPKIVDISQPTSVTTPIAPPTIKKEYTTDPYREPAQ